MNKAATERIMGQALRLVRPQFKLDVMVSPHGLFHWRQVWKNAEELCMLLGQNPAVPCWFAFLHDSQRFDDDRDPNHGRRGAEWAHCLHKQGHVNVSKSDLERLIHAIKDHSAGGVTDDVIIGICWDADRLDLSRPGVGIQVQSQLLSTGAAVGMLNKRTRRAAA